MFTPDVHLLTDPWAPHPVVNSRNICSGGGGGGGSYQVGNAPSAPDYTAYIAEMTRLGEQGQTWAKDLFSWAQEAGVNLMDVAKRLSGAAEGTAASQQAKSDDLMKTWDQNTADLYKAQSEDARRMITDLPTTEEQYGGRWGADTATAIDQQLAAEQRKQDALGISPGIASQALDTQARIGRATATTAATEMGRRAARDESRAVTTGALQSNQFIPGVAGQQAGLATANRGQAGQLANAGATTAAGLYNPSLGFYSASTPYMKAWGDTMRGDYQDRIASYSAQERAKSDQAKAAAESEGGGFMDLIGPIAGAAIGSIGGPMGAKIGSSIGGAIGSKITGAKSGGKIPKNGGRRIPRPKVPGYANGGAIDTQPPEEYGYMQYSMAAEGGPPSPNYIPPEASPSGGEQVDDVHAMVSAGEFVIPERTVDWYGEKFFQNLIAKADNEAQEETVAEPEEQQVDGQQMAALDQTPPMFRSEGARV